MVGQRLDHEKDEPYVVDVDEAPDVNLARASSVLLNSAHPPSATCLPSLTMSINCKRKASEELSPGNRVKKAAVNTDVFQHVTYLFDKMTSLARKSARTESETERVLALEEEYKFLRTKAHV